MAQERIFTDEDRDWLKENYPHLSNNACIKHLNCGYESLKRLLAECGLKHRNQTHINTRFKAKKEKKFLWLDVGALWQKECFNK